MATFNRKSVYKGGGASYVTDGVRGMIYMSASLFQGEAPASIEVQFDNLTPPDAAKVAREQAKEQRAADRAAKREARETERAQKRQAREDARAARIQEREDARAQRRQAAEERRAARKSARPTEAATEQPVGA